MSEIVIDRDDPEMELDPDEMALLEEIEIDPRPARSRRAPAPAQRSVEQVETIDAFMNPDKTSAPPPQPQMDDSPIDYHENDQDDMIGEDPFVRGGPSGAHGYTA